MSRIIAYIGLGSNLSSPIDQLNAALDSIAKLSNTDVIQTSSFYGSKPQGPQDQPDFVNAVCKISTQLSAQDLLKALQAIEQQQGRVKKRHWGERLIDLDILLYGNEIIQTEQLTVPHSQMHCRDFVLIPLAEVAPDLETPHKLSIKAMISELNESFLISLN